MPLYEYQCLKCRRKTEKIEPVAGPHLKKCPHCGGKVEALLSAPAIQFKGSGWYVTDYAGKSKSGDSSSSAASGSAKESGGSDASGSESAAKDSASKETSSKDTAAKDKKPAKKK